VPQKTLNNHTCRRGLLAPRSFIILASVVLLKVSVSSDKKDKPKPDSDQELYNHFL